MSKRFKRPKPAKWVTRAKSILEEQEPLSKQSWLRLLKSAVITHEKHVEALSFIAEHLTTEEGDRKATSDSFGIDASEVIEMAHDNMISTARAALRP